MKLHVSYISLSDFTLLGDDSKEDSSSIDGGVKEDAGGVPGVSEISL